MNKEKLSEALSYLDDDIIKETDALRRKHSKSRSSRIAEFTRKPWFKTALAAAALIVIMIGGGVVARNMNLGGKKEAMTNQKSLVSYDSMLMTNDSEAAESIRESKTVEGNEREIPGQADSVSKGGPAPAVTASSGANGKYDLNYITPFCNATCKNGKVSGTYGFDLSEDADYYVETGEEWALEMLKDDEWKNVALKEHSIVWPTPVYSVGQYPGTNHFEKNFNLDAYVELKDGKYRIVKKVSIRKSVNGSESIFDEVIYCDFEIKF